MKSAEMKEWRKRNNLTQAELSVTLGVSSRQVSRWETDVTTISKSIEMLLHIIEANREDVLKAIEAVQAKEKPSKAM